MLKYYKEKVNKLQLAASRIKKTWSTDLSGPVNWSLHT